MSAYGAVNRERSLERLRTGAFDVLVIGAGIVGARIAFEAACAGLKVAVVDAGDFGGATSSASGKLIHGGLRYLRTGRLRFVREARREQGILANRVAPHTWHAGYLSCWRQAGAPQDTRPSLPDRSHTGHSTDFVDPRHASSLPGKQQPLFRLFGRPTSILTHSWKKR
jgi:glycine/D-amino acid oxidase-like deaminating enzyme